MCAIAQLVYYEAKQKLRCICVSHDNVSLIEEMALFRSAHLIYNLLRMCALLGGCWHLSYFIHIYLPFYG